MLGPHEYTIDYSDGSRQWEAYATVDTPDRNLQSTQAQGLSWVYRSHFTYSQIAYSHFAY